MTIFLLFVVIIEICDLIGAVVTAVVNDEIVFKRLGSFKPPNSDVEKSYWVPRHFEAQWQYTRTRAIRRAYDFDIVSLDTLVAEMKAVIRMCEDNRDLFGSFVHIGGMAKTSRSKADWYWVNTISKVSCNMTPTWQNFNGEEWCLSLYKGSQFKFNDISCFGSWEEKFICEKNRKNI